MIEGAMYALISFTFKYLQEEQNMFLLRNANKQCFYKNSTYIFNTSQKINDLCPKLNFSQKLVTCNHI